MGRELGRLGGIELCNLGDEGEQLPKMRGLLVGVDLKYLTRGVVMIPLLQELFFVRNRVALDQILKLREI